MSKTRRHPNRPAPATVGPKLRRVEGGSYEGPDGLRVENANDGKRDACWNAYDRSNKLLATASTLRELRRKLARLGGMLALAAKMAGVPDVAKGASPEAKHVRANGTDWERRQ